MIGSLSLTPLRNRALLVLWHVLLVLSAAWHPGCVLAEDNPVTIAEQRLRDIKQELEQGTATSERYVTMNQDVDRIQRQAQNCIDDVGQQEVKLASDLESLGTAVAGEDASVTQARRDLEKNKVLSRIS